MNIRAMFLLVDSNGFAPVASLGDIVLDFNNRGGFIAGIPRTFSGSESDYPKVGEHIRLGPDFDNDPAFKCDEVMRMMNSAGSQVYICCHFIYKLEPYMSETEIQRLVTKLTNHISFYQSWSKAFSPQECLKGAGGRG